MQLSSYLALSNRNQLPVTPLILGRDRLWLVNPDCEVKWLLGAWLGFARIRYHRVIC